MPEYQTPEPDESVNVTQEHPLKDFFWLLGGAVVLLFATVFLIGLSAGWLASKIPFEKEKKIATQVFDTWDIPVNHRLQALADQLVSHMDLPPEMEITVHYSDESEVNAFAFLGGHIVIYKGLLDQLESENAIAMVLAHEIAHIRNRDPIRSLSRGLSISLVMSAVFGTSSDILVSATSQSSLLKFSRDQETEADRLALHALAGHYGHVQGATNLFDVFLEQQADHSSLAPVEFLSTHPLTGKRIEFIKTYAKEQNWPRQGDLHPVTPLD